MTTHIGFIGGGNITETHVRAARAVAGVEIAAIYGENAASVERLCREYGGMPYSDFSRFLTHTPMEMVAIGSPSALHAVQGTAAARRGLHVLTEKPIDTSTARADHFIAEAERARVKIGVFFQDRFKADARRLKQLLESGQLGKPILADARVKWYRPPEYYRQSRWRGKLALDGGGALMNQGIHTVDLLLWLLGDIVAVQSESRTVLHDIESEDSLTALLEFASGVMGVLVATTSTYPGYPRRLELSGTEGTVIFEHDRIIQADLRRPLPGLVDREEGDQNASASSAVVSDIRGHRAALEDFLHAIATGSRPVCDGREGRRSLAVVEAIYQAARTRERVLLS
jgi:UDP-N-acetyl-2-amino-2-deoxyglucuronate dehydrogenase